MTHSGKPESDLGFDSLSDQLRDSLSCDYNKPDFRELDLGSPVSPLRTRPTAFSSSTTSSSSSSSSGSVTTRNAHQQAGRRSDAGPSSHSGEIVGSPTGSNRNTRAGTARSDPGTTAHPLIYSGQSTATSPALNVLPTGNICPSGRIVKTGLAINRSSRSDVLGSGSGNYGHGSIMRGGTAGSSASKVAAPDPSSLATTRASPRDGLRRAMSSSDPEEVKRAGNEMYKKGHFSEALSLYDRAIALSPGNAAYRSNRAAALTGLGRIAEAVMECEEAVRLDPNYGRAHQRLASLMLRLGQVENAKKHLSLPAQHPDPAELQKLAAVEKHLNKCTDARRIGDWKSALKECESVIAAGADISPQLFMCRVEAFLKLDLLEDAESSLLSIPKLEPSLRLRL